MQAKRAFGVFLIRNTINDKVYLASGMDIQGIVNRHKFALSMGGHQSKELQKELEDLFNSKNESRDKNKTSIPATFLRVMVKK